jgi:hypothetical protein
MPGRVLVNSIAAAAVAAGASNRKAPEQLAGLACHQAQGPQVALGLWHAGGTLPAAACSAQGQHGSSAYQHLGSAHDSRARGRHDTSRVPASLLGKQVGKQVCCRVMCPQDKSRPEDWKNASGLTPIPPSEELQATALDNIKK